MQLLWWLMNFWHLKPQVKKFEIKLKKSYNIKAYLGLLFMTENLKHPPENVVESENINLDIPEKGKNYRVVFKKTEGRGFKAKFKFSGKKQAFLLLPEDWTPWEEVEYEVVLTHAINRGERKNYHGLWTCKPVNAKRDQTSYLLKNQQRVFDELAKNNE